MTQLSRPYQIALLMMALFVAVWFAVLRGHVSAPETSSPAPVPAAPAAVHPARSAAPGTTAKVAAKGVPAVHRAATHHTTHATPAHVPVTRAHKPAAVSHPHSARTHAPGRAHGATAKPHTKARAVTTVASRPPAAVKAPAAARVPAAPKLSAPATSKALNLQASVEAQLSRGHVVAILFLNPRGVVDGVVGRELTAATKALRGKLAVFRAEAGQVGSFGTITRDVQIDQTPTLMLIRKTGSADVITGLTDAFAIEQAIEELGS